MSTTGTVLTRMRRTLQMCARMLAGTVPFVVVLWAVPVLAQVAPRTIENRATATYQDAEGNLGPTLEARVTIILQCRLVITICPDSTLSSSRLGVSKSVDRSLVSRGDTITYTVRWRGLGPATVRNVLITDTLPPSVRLVASRTTTTAGALTITGGRRVEVAIPEVPVGDSGTLTVVAVAEDSSGTAHNVANATYLAEDRPILVLSDTTHTFIEPPTLLLSLDALVDRPLRVGETFEYRLRARNASDRLTLRDVVIIDTLPTELVEVSSQPAWAALQRQPLLRASLSDVAADAHVVGETRSVVRWIVPVIAPGDSIDILLRVRVVSVGSGSLVNVANATASVSTAVTAVTAATATTTTTVEAPIGVLRVVKRASALEVSSGDAVAYVTTVVNAGNTSVRDAELRIALGEGFRLHRPTIQGGEVRHVSDTTIRVAVGTLEAGDSAVVQYAGTVVGVRGALVQHRAVAHGAADSLPMVRSDTAGVTVRVRAGVLESRFAVGRVWLDEDGDGRLGSAERPLAHALLWLSHGQTIRTDSLGRFTIPDLDVGRYTIRVDPLSIPVGYHDPIVRSFRIDGAVAPVLNLALPTAPGARATVDRSLGAAFLFAEAASAMPTPRIATPRSGSIVGTNRLFLRVEGEPATTVVLYQNDAVVARETLRPDGSMDFIGLELTPGRTVFRAVFMVAGGAQTVESTVHFSGAPARIERTAAAPIRAGATSVVAFKVTDAWGEPVAQRPLATITSDGARLLDADADPFSVGTQVAVDGQGMLLVRVHADSAGLAPLRVTFDAVAADAMIEVLPEIRRVTVVADGELGIGRTTPSYGAAIARGALDDATAVTLSYDSRRTRANAFAGVFDPLDEGRFPVLGDASERTIIGSATVPLSLRVERDQSWLLFGDIVTKSFADATSPAYYSRALPGASASWSQGRVTTSAFGSVVGQQLVQKQIRGNGTSGPYDLGGAIRPGTDRLVIETRDRVNASVIIARQDLERFVDYDIDPPTGAVLLRRPLLATDASGNPTMLVAFAERTDGPSAFVGGVRAAVQMPTWRSGLDSLLVGASLIEDQSALGGHRVLSSDLQASRGRSGARLEFVQGERADSADHAVRASAWLGAPTATGVMVDWTTVGDRFVNPGNASVMAGTTDLRVAGRARVSDAWTLGGNLGVQSFRALGAERRSSSLSATRAAGDRKATMDVGVMDERIARDTMALDVTSLTSKLSYTAGKATAWVDALQPLSPASADTRPATYGIGTSYDLGKGVHAELAHRIMRTDSATAGLTTFGVRSELPTRTRLWSEYRLGSNVASQQSAVLVGIGQTLRVTPSLSVDGQFERRQGLSNLPLTDPSRALPFAQVESDRTTTAVGIEWRPRTSETRAALRAELTDGDAEGRGARVFGSVESALTPSWTFLARHDGRVQDQRVTVPTTQTRTSRSMLAAAFRPAGRSDWNALAKVERRVDQNPQRAAGTILSGTDDRMIGAVETIWSPGAGRELGVRLAWRHAEQAGMLAGGADLTTVTQYVGARWVQRLHARLDARVTGRQLSESRSGARHWDLAPAFAVRLVEGVELEAGYRFGDVRDVDFAPNGGRGAYAALGVHLTEQTGQRVADFWRARMDRP